MNRFNAIIFLSIVFVAGTICLGQTDKHKIPPEALRSDAVIRKVDSFTNVDSIKNLRDGERVQFGDDPDVFIYDSTSTTTENANANGPGTILNGPNDVGRFFRQYEGPVRPEWWGAVGDGVTDDTAAIQAAIDSGEPVLLESNTTYKLLSGLTGGKLDVRGGEGTTFDGPGNSIALFTVSTSNTTVNLSDFSVVNVKHTLFIDGTNLSVGDITIERVSQTGGYVAIRDDVIGDVLSYANIDIRDCKFSNLDATGTSQYAGGIKLYSTNGWDKACIENVTVDNVDGTDLLFGIYLAGGTSGTANNTVIQNCRVNDLLQGASPTNTNVYGILCFFKNAKVSQNTITDCTCTATTTNVFGIYTKAERAIISDNHVTDALNNAGGLITIKGLAENDASGSSPFGYGCIVKGNNLQVSSLSMPSPIAAAIYISEPDQTTVVGNSIKGGYRGIQTAKQATIVANVIEGVSENAIQSSDGNQEIRDNVIRNFSPSASGKSLIYIQATNGNAEAFVVDNVSINTTTNSVRALWLDVRNANNLDAVVRGNKFDSGCSYLAQMNLVSGTFNSVRFSPRQGVSALTGTGTSSIILDYESLTTTSNSTTPSVAGVEQLIVNNTVATSITSFTNGVAGQSLTVHIQDANTNITGGGGNIVLVPNTGIHDQGTYHFYTPDGATWYEVGAPGVDVNAVVSDYAGLRALSTATGDLVYVNGRTSNADGGQGFFQDIGLVSSYSGITDDDGYHLFTTGGTRVMRRLGKVRPEHYGAIVYQHRDDARAGSDNSSDEIAKCEAIRANWEGEIEFTGVYRCTQTITFENWGTDILMGGDGAFWFAGGSRIVGVEIVDAPSSKDNQTNTPRYHLRVLKDKGAAGNAPDWATDTVTYVYDNVFDKSSNVWQNCFDETDIGVHLKGVSSVECEVDVSGFCIGVCEDTLPGLNASGYSAWNEISGQTIGCKFAYVAKSRGNRDLTVADGWLNQSHVKLSKTNVGGLATPRSSYGIVILCDPALAAVNDEYVPTGFDLFCSHEGYTTGGVEACPLIVARGARGFWTGRNDASGLKWRIFDTKTQPEVASVDNGGWEIHPTRVWSPDQFEIANGAANVVIAPGADETHRTMVQVEDLESRIVGISNDGFGVKGQYLGFIDYSASSQPVLDSWKALTRFNGDGTVNLDPLGVVRGGVGAMIKLGEKAYGGGITVNVAMSQGSHRLVAFCYDSAGNPISSYPAEGWLIRDTRAESGNAVYNWQFTGSMLQSNSTTLSGEKTLRFHSSVDKAFIAVIGDHVTGFTMSATRMPGAQPIVINDHWKTSGTRPNAGCWRSTDVILNSTTSARNYAWVMNGTVDESNPAYAVTGNHTPSTTVYRGAYYRIDNAGTNEIWSPTSGFASGRANGSATCGTNTPTGAVGATFADDAGITWTHVFDAPNIASFVPLNIGGEITTASDGDTTPSVLNTDILIVNNTSATSISTFDDGYAGQTLTVHIQDTNTGITSGSSLNLDSTDGNYAAQPGGATFEFYTPDGTIWYEVSRRVF